jgi:hypothetical protein
MPHNNVIPLQRVYIVTIRQSTHYQYAVPATCRTHAQRIATELHNDDLGADHLINYNEFDGVAIAIDDSKESVQ